MIIECSKNHGALEFSEPEGLLLAAGTEYFRVTVKNQHLWATAKVYAFDPFDYGLANFFEELAVNWKGFDGEKAWTSLEEELALVCTSDGLGHFAIKTTIKNDLDTCSVNTIYVEAGQLGKIAREVKMFFDVSAGK